MTFPQTQTILDGVNVAGVTLDDIQTVLNLRDAWRFMFSTIEEPFTLEYVCKLNEYISRNESLEWGKLRTGAVGISGTDYVLPIPSAKTATSDISAIIENPDASNTEKALLMFLCIAKSQLFWMETSEPLRFAPIKY